MLFLTAKMHIPYYLEMAMLLEQNLKALVEQVVNSPRFRGNRIIHQGVPSAKLKTGLRYILGDLQKFDLGICGR